MEIFLTILRVTGIVLLCILAFVILLLLLLVFWPYPYRADVKKDESLKGRVRLRWLVFFLIADLLYEGDMNLRIRILGIPVYDKKRKAEKAAQKEEKRRKKEEAEAAKKKKPKKDEEKPSGEDKPEELKEKASSADTEKPSGDKPSEDKPRKEKAPGEKKEEPERKESLFERAEKAFEKILDFLEELPDKLDEGTDKLVEKLEGAFEKLEFYIHLLESSGTAWVIEYVKKRVIGILKSIRPTRLDAAISVKNEDPATVAKVYEYYALSLPLWLALKGNVTVEAEQDQSELRGEVHLKGRILLFQLLWHAGLLLLNKKVKTFLKLLKNGKQEEEKDG
ncbi:MAG: hypothetical protein IK115_08910 [Lachnospiraceae bacterium]|nr:hypothetical protein [Lachnospiraceae bacterium]